VKLAANAAAEKHQLALARACRRSRLGAKNRVRGQRASAAARIGARAAAARGAHWEFRDEGARSAVGSRKYLASDPVLARPNVPIRTARQGASIPTFGYAGNAPPVDSDADGNDYKNKPACPPGRLEELKRVARLNSNICVLCKTALSGEWDACGAWGTGRNQAGTSPSDCLCWQQLEREWCRVADQHPECDDPRPKVCGPTQ